MTIYFDGACEPKNPYGNMGFAAVLSNEKIIKVGFEPESPDNSSNVAEYSAFLLALDIIEEEIKNGVTNFELLGDSQLVVEQMAGRWQIKQGLYKMKALKARQRKAYIEQLGVKIKVRWIPREQNELADKYSKSEFAKRGIQETKWK